MARTFIQGFWTAYIYLLDQNRANGVVPAKAEALISAILSARSGSEKVFQCIKRHVEMMGYDNVKGEMMVISLLQKRM